MNKLLLFLILIPLVILTPKLWAQSDNCVEANGLTWCYNNQACGEPCFLVCLALGMGPIVDYEGLNIWFEAQNSLEECQAISQAFGLGTDVMFNNYTYACLEDARGTHSAPGGLIPPLHCSSFVGCPTNHISGMDQGGVDCTDSTPLTRRSICPCLPPDDFDGIPYFEDNCPKDYNPGQEDSDGDGIGDVCDICANDEDQDGVCGDMDICPGTVLPESVPTQGLGTNRFANTDTDIEFETTSPEGNGPQKSFTMEHTHGCSCEQIILDLDLGEGHTKYGCSISAMEDFILSLE